MNISQILLRKQLQKMIALCSEALRQVNGSRRSESIVLSRELSQRIKQLSGMHLSLTISARVLSTIDMVETLELYRQIKSEVRVLLRKWKKIKGLSLRKISCDSSLELTAIS